MNIAVEKETIAGFCRTHHIRRLSLFGSVLGNQFRADSDIDILVEFAPGHSASLFKMAEMEQELSAIFGGKVDLRTPAELSRYFREEVLQSCSVQYAEK